MSQLVSDGLNLALYGMGTVFVFLTLLVFATRVMSWLVLRFAPLSTEATTEAATGAAGQATTQTGASAGGKKMAAISAALHQHRQRQQQ